MKPIDPRWLPQTVTLYNLFIDPADGTRQHFRTVLEGVRVQECRVTLASSTQGFERKSSITVIIDRRSTAGQGETQAKQYVPPHEWKARPRPEREQCWTLAEGDLMAVEAGARQTLAPERDPETETESRFVQTNRLKTITALKAVVDWDGSIHHWEAEVD